MATDPHIHQGKHHDLRISPTSDPQVVEVELFNRSDRRGLFTEVPVAKLRSMIDASSPTLGAYTRHEKHDAAHDIDWQAVAEEHEDTIRALVKQRDEARRHEGVAAEQATEQARLAQKALRERDEAVTELRLYELREKLTPAAVSRPLTPDAITDEMVKRGAEKFRSLPTAMTATDRVHCILAAALTEPPARPEGAEEIEALLTGNYAEPKYVADFLAEHGVRVVTEEQP